METGWIFYVLFAGLMVVFWRHPRGRPEHPGGGTWTEHRAWTAETEKKKRKRKKRSRA